LHAQNVELERELEKLDVLRLKRMSARGWYDFLRNDYFRWKYTAPKRYVTTTRQLERYLKDDRLDELDKIRERLLALDPQDTHLGLMIASQIHGLGAAGASGLLALMYPKHFGTVDQFVVKGLQQVDDLPEKAALARMNPEGLQIDDGVLLIGIMKRKAQENNRLFNGQTWTPRMVDKVLWACGR